MISRSLRNHAQKALALSAAILVTSNAVAQTNSNLCIGIRGNGFKVVATLNALARITEESGVPDKLLGGSSGSVAMFLTDSAAMNPWLSEIGVEPKIGVALMLKAVPEFLSEIENLPEFVIAAEFAKKKEMQAEAKEIMKDLGVASGLGKVGYATWKYATSPTFRKLAKIKNSIYLKDLVDPDFLKYSKETSNLEGLVKNIKNPMQKAQIEAQIAFRKSQAKSAMSNPTVFSVMDRDNMFFTPGLVSVKGIAKLASRVASFYAGYNMPDAKDQLALKNWLKKCAPISAGKTFAEMIQIEPACATDLRQMAAKYIRHFDHQLKAVEAKNTSRCESNVNPIGAKCAKFRHEDPIGTKIDAYAVVATVTGNSVQTYFDTLKKFDSAVDSSVGRGFSIDPKDFKYGYFGNVERFNGSVRTLTSGPFLDSSERRLDFTNDYKTQLAHALGTKTWLEAIHSSGSEPSRTRPIPLTDALGARIITVGGWADGYPAHILKGMGCQTTAIIVTNSKPGPSLSENTIQKLMPTLSGFSGLTNTDVAYGNNDRQSVFGMWRNIGNPESSESRSANAADAVYCSLWNDEVPFSSDLGLAGSMNRLAEVGYRAQVFIPETVAANHPVRSWTIPAIVRDDLKQEIVPGRPKFVGCILPN